MTKAANKGFQQETVIRGLSLSGGTAVARVCRFNESRHNNLDVYKVKGKGVDAEVERVKRAASLVVKRVEELRKETEARIGKAEAEIFIAHRMILEDEVLVNAIEDIIRKEGTNAEAAVMVVLDSYEARMRQIDNEYLKEKAGDFVEIKNRLLDILRDMNPAFQCVDSAHCQKGKQRIIVASELTPGMTIEMDTSHTLGFVTERGGRNSHAAILARALGIPAVSGISDIHAKVSCGTEIIIDGDAGQIILWPKEKTVAKLKKAGRKIHAPAPVDPVEEFSVMANISTADDVDDAVAMGSEGVGLYRTEYEFITAGRFLDEDEQLERYKKVLEGMSGKPVVFRLFDAGGDKPLPFLDELDEDNPALGLRGGRLLLGHAELFAAQARAIAKASQYGEAWVMYPMVVDLAQFRKLKKFFEDAVSGIECNLKHGVMLEVPSACLDARRIMKEADFASIGTNDLIQYLFAVDRNNISVSQDYSPGHNVFWKLVGSIVRACEAAQKPLSLCGEIAGDPKFARKLLQKRIRTVSVSVRLVSGTRLAVLNERKKNEAKEK